MYILPKANREVAVTMDRGGQLVEARLTPDSVSKYELGEIGIAPEARLQLTIVSPDGPAARAGLRVRDVLLSVDGNTDVEPESLTKYINAASGRAVAFTVLRDGREETVHVTPEGTPGLVGIGWSPYETRIVQPGFFEAIGMSVERNWTGTKMIVTTLAGLFTRETPVRQLMGPVAIGEMSGTMAQLGWLALFNFMAMISLNLGLINLMPIPVLDGGHIAILGLEGLARRDFSIKVKEKVLIAGFALILMLMVTVIYNDLTRVAWIERFMFWRQ